MPEIKHDFTGGKMNKDVDERLLRNGEYRHAENIQIRTTDSNGSGDGVGDSGTAQNIKGNRVVAEVDEMYWHQLSDSFKHICVASIADEKSDKSYWFMGTSIVEPLLYSTTQDAVTLEVTTSFNTSILSGWQHRVYTDLIIEYRSDGTHKIVVADTFKIIDRLNNVVATTTGIDVTTGWSQLTMNSLWQGVIRPGMVMQAVGTNGLLFEKPPVIKAVDGINVMFNEEVYVDLSQAIMLTFSAPRVLNFSVTEGSQSYRDFITGINIIDNLLFWTDGNSEPKKINIDRCISGTPQSTQSDIYKHTKVHVEDGNRDLVDVNTLENELDNGGVDDGSGVNSYLKEEHLTVIRPAPRSAPTLKMSRATRVGTSNISFTYAFVDTGSNLVLEQNETFIIESNNFSSTTFKPNDLLLISSPDDLTVKFNAVFDTYLLGDSETSTTTESQSATSIIRIKTTQGNLNVTIATTSWNMNLVQPNPLFELNLVRFAYRYQYEDGEYSAISPWSEVAFLPKPFGYTTKNAYNIGMENDLRDLKIRDFLPYKKPLDVKKVDILYKSTSSPNVYIVESVERNKSAEWELFTPKGSSDLTIKRGELSITSEMVHRVLSSDQVLRGWDNVPRVALSQEITGNRLVYGNYIQGYNLDAKVSLIHSIQSNDSPNISTPKKSIKSMRDYKIGMVFGDKYGRETPVLEASYAMGMDLDGADHMVSTNDISVPKRLSVRQNSFTVKQIWGDLSLEETPPTLNNGGWMDYVKYYIKEVSSEYYNIVMDRWYASGDQGTLWLSFNSADRNKVDEDTHLILKNRNGSDAAVLTKARYKIIAIKSEAPEYIKTYYNLLGDVEISNSNTTESGGALNTDTASADYNPSTIWGVNTPNSGTPSGLWSGDKWLRIKKSDWQKSGIGGDNNEKSFGKDITGTVEWRIKACSNSVCLDTPWTKATSVHRSGESGAFIQVNWTPTLEQGKFDLYNQFIELNAGGWTEYDVASMVYRVEFRESVVENKPEFDGKFFVKINMDATTSDNIQTLGQATYIPDSTHDLYYISSTTNSNATSPISTVTSSGTFYSGQDDGWFLDAFDNVTASADYDFEFTNASEMLISSDGSYEMAESYIITDGLDDALPDYVSQGPVGGFSPFGSCSANYDEMTRDFWEDWYDIPNFGAFWFFTLDEFGKDKVFMDNTNTCGIRYFAGEQWDSGLNPQADSVWDASSGKGPNGEGGWSPNVFKEGEKPGQYTGAGDQGNCFYKGVGSNYDGSFGAQGDTLGSVALSWSAGSFDGDWDWGEPALITALSTPGTFFKFNGDGSGAIYKTLGCLYEAESSNFHKRLDDSDGGGLPVQTQVVNGAYTNMELVNCTQYSGVNTYGTLYTCTDGSTVNTCTDGWGAACGQTFTEVNYCGTKDEKHPINRRRTRWIEFRKVVPETGQTLNVGLDPEEFDPRNLIHHDGRDSTSITILTVTQEESENAIINSPIGAVFETEPKESADLDIYYEASSSIPMSLNKNNAFDFAPIDSRVIVFRNVVNQENMFEEVDYHGYETAMGFSKNLINHRVGNIFFTNINEKTNSNVDDSDVIIQLVGDATLVPGGSFEVDEDPLLVKEVVKVGDTLKFRHSDNTSTKSKVTGTYEPIDPNTGTFTALSTDDNDHGVVSGPKAFRKINPLTVTAEFNSTTGVLEANPADVPTEIVSMNSDYYVSSVVFISEIISILFGINVPIVIEIPNGPSPTPGTSGTNDDGENFTTIPMEGDPIYNSELATQTTPLWMELNGVPTDQPIQIQFSKFTGYYSIDMDVWKYEVGLPWFNCYSYGNGVESDRIRDDFNAPQLDNGVKVSTTFSGYGEERIGSGMIYSGIYNSTSQVNDLNEFNMSEKITKSLNPTYGSIQRMKVRDTDMVVFTEDKVLKVLSNKDAVFNADGNPQLTATDKVLGQVVPFVGDYGISNNPESLAWDQYRMYFTDKQRGAVLRLSRDGLTPISSVGMKTWFRDNLNKTEDLVGTFDTVTGEYNLTLKFNSQLLKTNTSVSFNEASKGWVSFKSFVPDSGLSVSGSYYTSKFGGIYEHHVIEEATSSVVVPRNKWYKEDPKESSITVLLNDSPSQIKSFKTISYEGSQARINKFFGESTQAPNGGIEFDAGGFAIQPTYSSFVANDNEYYNLIEKRGWYASDVVTDLQQGKVNEFKDKEGKWFNQIQGVESSINNIDTSEFTVQGVGMVSDVIYTGDIYTGGPDCYDENGNLVDCDSVECIGEDCCEGEDCGSWIQVLGCMDEDAVNFQINANTDDGSCIYNVMGCLDPIDPNYNPLADIQAPSGSADACQGYVFGCMDENAFNYDSTATISGVCWDSNYLIIDCVVNGDNGVEVNPNLFIFSYDFGSPPTSSCIYCEDANGDGECDEIVDCPDGYEEQDGDCVEVPNDDVYGCTNPCLENYNPYATLDDGSCGDCVPGICDNCFGDDVIGCMDDGGVLAGGTYLTPQYPGNPSCTYNPDATMMDWSMCTYSCYSGCTDFQAINFCPTCLWDDGSCAYDEIPIVGCMDQGYVEYNPTANVPCFAGDVDEFTQEPIVADVGSCCENLTVEPCTPGLDCEEIGCMDDTATNYNEDATIPCGGVFTLNPTGCCIYDYDILGCTDETALNYDEDATFDDGSCVPTIPGCTDATAQNYSEIANFNDGSCIPHIFGCIDETMWNYDPSATMDDGGCIPYLYGCMDPDATNYGQGYVFDSDNNQITEDSPYWDATVWPAQAEYNGNGNVYYTCEFPDRNAKLRASSTGIDPESELIYEESNFYSYGGQSGNDPWDDDDNDGIPNIYEDDWTFDDE